MVEMLTPHEVGRFADWFAATARNMASLRSEQRHEDMERCDPSRLIRTMRGALGDERMLLWFAHELRGLRGFTDRLDAALTGLANAH